MRFKQMAYIYPNGMTTIMALSIADENSEERIPNPLLEKMGIHVPDWKSFERLAIVTNKILFTDVRMVKSLHFKSKKPILRPADGWPVEVHLASSQD